MDYYKAKSGRYPAYYILLINDLGREIKARVKKY
jgi:hypothetical protein